MTAYRPLSASGPSVTFYLQAGDSFDVISSVYLINTSRSGVLLFTQGYDVTVTIDGRTFGSLFVDGQNSVMTIGSTGYASASGYATVLGAGSLTNNGEIEQKTTFDPTMNTGFAVDWTGDFTNSGNVIGETYFSGALVNSGTMQGVTGSGDANGNVGVRNLGTIAGDVVLGGKSVDFSSAQGSVSGTIEANGQIDKIIAGVTGGSIVGGFGNDSLEANQSQTAADNAAHFTLDGGSGQNNLVGGGAFNTFVAGDAAGGFTQIHGAASTMAGVAGYANNTVDFSGTPDLESVFVDLLKGHNAYVNSSVDNTSAYTLEDAIQNVPNVIGSGYGDIIIADNGSDRIQGGGGGDRLIAGTGQDTFVYKAYDDSDLEPGYASPVGLLSAPRYDTIVGFKTGTDKLDLSALSSNASHLVIQSNATSTALYVEQTPGQFTIATDLAISFQGANAIHATDVIF